MSSKRGAATTNLPRSPPISVLGVIGRLSLSISGKIKRTQKRDVVFQSSYKLPCLIPIIPIKSFTKQWFWHAPFLSQKWWSWKVVYILLNHPSFRELKSSVSPLVSFSMFSFPPHRMKTRQHRCQEHLWGMSNLRDHHDQKDSKSHLNKKTF